MSKKYCLRNRVVKVALTVVLALMGGLAPTAVGAPNGYAWMYSTSVSGGGTDLNQATATALSWKTNMVGTAVFLDDAVFYDTTDTDTLKVKVAGDYLVSYTIPMRQSVNDRSAIRAEVYVNGTVVPGSRSECSYIRRGSGPQYHSSDHCTVLCPGLSAEDTIEVRVMRGANNIAVTMDEPASLYVEKIDAARTVFAGRGTATTAGTDLNPAAATALKWATEDRKNSGFTHAATSETITLDAAGDYLVFVNVPLQGGNADRDAPKMRIKLNGVNVPGGQAKQGYIRRSGQNYASVHWSGLVRSSAASGALTITMEREAAAGAVPVPTGKEFSIYVERIDTSSGVYYGRGTRPVSGTNWAPTSPDPIQWANDDIIDSALYGHSTSVNSHQVTVNDDGDYLLVYNDSMYSTGTRANNKITVEVNGTPRQGAQTKCHFIRNGSGHNESSGTLVHLLHGLVANDVVTVSTKREENTSWTITSDDDALLMLWKKDAPGGPTIRNQPVTGVTGSTAATLNAEVRPAGATVYATVYWGQTDGGTNVADWAHSNTLATAFTGADPILTNYTATVGLSEFGTNYFTWRVTNATVSSWAEPSLFWSGQRVWAGSEDDLWGTTGNWVGDNVPDVASESALFAGAGAGDVDLNGSSYTIGDMTLSGGDYTILDNNGTPGALTVSSVLNSGGDNTISVELNNSGAVETTGGSLTLANLPGLITTELTLNGGALNVKAGGAILPIRDGLELWMDASQITGYSDGQIMTQWLDSSGKGHHTTLVRGDPQYIASFADLNDKPSVYFDGNDGFQLGDLGASFPSAATWFIVTRMNNSSDPSTLYLTKSSDHYEVRGGSGSYLNTFRNGRADNKAIPYVANSTAKYLVAYESSASSWQAWLDGTSYATHGASYQGGNLHSIAYRASNNDRYLKGYISEIVIYNRTLSAAEHNAVGSYLSSKYNLTTAYTPEPEGIGPGSVSLSSIPVDASASSTIGALATSQAAFGDLTIGNGVTLTTSGSALGFKSTTIPASVTTVGIDAGTTTYLTDNTGMDASGASVTIAKTGSGQVVLDRAGSNLGSASFDIQVGALVGVHASAFGGAALSINSGELLLSSPGGNITYAKDVAVVAAGTLTAGMAGSGVAGPLTNTLSGNITFTGTPTLTTRATDDYTLRLAGQINGAGMLNLTSGSVIIDDTSFNGVTLAGGSLAVYDNLTVASLIQSSGTFSMLGANKDLTVSGTLTLAGTLNFSGGPNLVLTTAAVTLNSPANITYDKDLTAANITINNGSTLNLGNNALTVSGTLTLNNGGNLNLGSNALNVGSFVWNQTGNLTLTGPITASTSMSFWPQRTIANKLLGAGGVNIGYNPEGNWGYVELTGANEYTGPTQIGRGTLRVTEGVGLPAASRIIFNQDTRDEYGVIETSGTFARNIGTGAGQVYWTNMGGFAAYGGDLIVTLNSGSTLDWSNTSNGFNNRDSVQFGSPTATGMVELTNPINLNNATRRIQVCNNFNVTNDFLRLSGVISGNGGQTSTQLRFNEGHNNQFYDSFIELTGVNTFTQRLLIDAAAVYAVDGVGFPAASQLYFEGNSDAYEAIFLSQGTLNRPCGNVVSGVYWGERGGFAARGGPLTVNLGSGALLTWGNPSNGFQGRNLQMGSMYADNVVELVNNIAMGGNRNIFVFDNPNTDQDVAKLSGVISGVNNQLRKYGGDAHRGGTLWLSGANTYSGNTWIDEGVIRAIDGVGLPTASRLYFEADAANRPCVLESSGTFTRDIANAAGNYVTWAANGGGFAAWGGPLAVNLESGIEILWTDVNTGFNSQNLHLGSPSANDVVDFQNDINLNANWRNTYLFDNPYSDTDYAVLSGAIRNGYMRFYGDGTVKFTGTNSFTYINARGTTKVFVNGVQNGMTWVYTENNQAATLGGKGTINSTDMEIRTLGTLAPGDSAGTLTTAISSAQGLRMYNNSIYAWELGPGAADTVNQTGNLTLDSGWTLKLLSDGGTPLPTQEYVLFTYTGTFSGSVTPTSIDTNSIPADWVADDVEVLHDTVGKRIYLTGLYSLLSVANGEPTDLTSTSATLNGFISAQADPLYVSVYWSTSNGETDPAIWLATGFSADKGVFSDVVGQPVSHPVTGLDTNELWYYTFHATNAANTINLWAVPSMSFNALGPPVVTNTGVSGFGFGTATLNGEFDDHNRGEVTLCWGTTDGGTDLPSAWQHSTNIGVQAGETFAGTATSVLYGGEYVYRIYAENDYGTAWSDPATSFAPALKPGLPDGLEVWLDASQITGVSGGTLLDTWPDVSGKNHNATSSGGDRPTYIANGLNGLPVVRFAEHIMTLGNLSSFFSSAGTYLAAVTVNDSTYNILSTRNNDARDRGDGVETRMGAFRNGRVNLGSNLMPTTGSHIFANKNKNNAAANSDWIFYLNGNQIGAVNDDYVAGDNWRIGGRGDNAQQRLTGDMAEVIVFNRYLDAAELQRIGGYLAWKYGISTAYPAGGDIGTSSTIENRQATAVGLSGGTMNAEISCQGAVYDVWVHWDADGGGSTPGDWANRVLVGTVTGGTETVSQPVTTGVGTWYYTFHASNALNEIWATPSTNFTTVTGPAVNNSTGADVSVGEAILRGNLTAGSQADIYIYWGRTNGLDVAEDWEYVVALPDTLQGAFQTTIAAGYGFDYYYTCRASNQADDVWAAPSESFSMPEAEDYLTYTYVNGLRSSAFQGTPNNDTPFNLTGSDYKVSFTRVFTGSKANTILALAENPTYNVIANQNIENFNMPGGDNFITAISGAFFPPVDGSYRFNGSGDDRTQFYIDLNGDHVFTSDETESPYTYDNSFDFSKTLVANREYRCMFLFQEHGGGESYWFNYTVPGQGNVRVNPANASQLGQWRYATDSTPYFTMTNTAVSGLGTDKATLNADFDADGWSVDVYVYYGTNDAFDVAANWDTNAFVGTFHNPTGAISFAVSNLALQTQHYYAFFASNAVTNIWAQPSVGFETLSEPVAENGSATDITQTSVTLGATLSGGGKGELRIYWGLEDGETNDGVIKWQNTNSFGEVLLGAYTTNLPVLAGAPYFYRVYATNDLSDDWADATATFNTPVPAVTLSAVALLDGFSPTNIPGCQVWFDASQGVSLSGSTVTQWDDQSGNNRHATTPSGTPEYIADLANGRPAIKFRNEFLRINHSFEPREEYIVFRSGRYDQSGQTGATWGPDWGGPFGQQNDNGWMLQAGTRQFWGDGSRIPLAVSQNGTAIVQNNPNGTPFGLPNVEDYMILKVNPQNYASANAYIGKTANSWGNHYDDIAEIIVYDRLLTKAEEDRIGAYLAGKYGIATAYPFNENDGQGLVTATLSNPSVSNVTVNFSFAGDAVKDVDYSSSADSIVIANGSLSSNITLTGIDDALQEEDEDIIVSIASLINATNGSPATATLFITSDDPQVTNGSGATSPTENSVTLNGLLTMGDSATIKIFWGDSDGIMNAANWGATNELGVKSEDVAFSTNITGLLANKTYYYRTYATNDSLLGEDWADSTVSFNTGIPSVTIDDVTVTEGDNGTVDATFTITISTLSAIPVSVTATAAAGTAVGGVHYTSTNGTVTVPAEQPSATFTVKVIGNNVFDNPDRFFYVNLTNPSGCTIADNQGVGTIRDDDAAEYLAAWRNWMPITFNGYAGTSTLTNWPALVRFSTSIPNFVYSTFGAPATGGDLRFVTEDRTRVLNFEIERWVNGGESVVWVQLPELPPAGTTIYAYWNNPGETTLPTYATDGSTWSEAGFKGVWHMNERNVKDATAYGNNGTGYDHVGDAEGNIGLSQTFDGANDWIDMGDKTAFQLVGDFTVSAWVRPDIGASGERVICNKWGNNWIFGLNNRVPRYHISEWREGGGTLPADQWSMVTLVRNGNAPTRNEKIYVNGVQTYTVNDNDNPGTSGSLQIGQWGGRWFFGRIDELRISQANRTPDWLKANYDNQKPSSTFNTFGSVAGLPLITIVDGATGITTDSAYLTARCTSTGGVATATWVYWGDVNGEEVRGNWGASQYMGQVTSVPTNYSFQAESLDEGTQYFYAYVASNVWGESWASSNFYTKGSPVVTHGIGAEPGIGYATLNGNLISDGGAAVEVYTYWGDNDGDTNKLTPGTGWDYVINNDISGLGAFASNTPPTLVYGKQYYYRVYATNASGYDAWSPATESFSTFDPLAGASGTGGTVTNYTLNGTNFTAHIFTNSGEFAVSIAGNVEVLVVGGGGGGGKQVGGGGGAGGFVEEDVELAEGLYTIHVGAGGLGARNGVNEPGYQGEDSFLSNATVQVVAIGGGGGASYNGIPATTGGSGGGGGGNATAGALGTPGQGSQGGNGYNSSWAGGGGGGAGYPGSNATASYGGDGGDGKASSFASGSPAWYAGGGGGCSDANNVGSDGGLGGGGKGRSNAANPPQNGAANTGGGGGGCRDTYTDDRAGAGGSGIVIVRYVTGAGNALKNLAASNVTQTSATLAGTLNASGAVYTVTLYWGDTDPTTNAGLWANPVSLGSYSNVLTNLTYATGAILTPGTPYYYAFSASNSAGVIWAQPSTAFYTDGPPTINNASGATPDIGFATLSGNLTSTGGVPTDVYTYWGDNDGDTNGLTPGIGWDYVITNDDVTGIGPFSTNTPATLLYGQRYYYRTFASNIYGGNWAPSTESFLTLSPQLSAPDVISININGNAASSVVTGPAGAIPATNWNNQVSSASEGSEAVHSQSGAAAGTFTWDYHGTLYAGGPSEATQNNKLFRRYADCGGDNAANSTVLTVSDLPPSLDGYDVYVYMGGDSDHNSVITVTGTDNAANTRAKYLISNTSTLRSGNPLVESTATVSGSATPANYVVLTGFTGDEITLTFAGGRARPTGLQVVFDAGTPGGTLVNTPATDVTHNTAELHATLGCTGAVYDVTAFWGEINRGTNSPIPWANSAPAGSYTNDGAASVSCTATGLDPLTTYYFTFRATNATETLWATNVLSFETVTDQLGAIFTGTPVYGRTPLEVTFTDTSTGTNITSREWDFGDGGSTNTSETVFTYTYTNAGRWDVELTVRDAATSGSSTETKVEYIVTASGFINIAGGNWSSAASWQDGDGPVFPGEDWYGITFNASPYTGNSVNDLGNGLLLNQLAFSPSQAPVTISGNGLTFTNSTTGNPQINQDSASAVSIQVSSALAWVYTTPGASHVALNADTIFGGTGAGTVSVVGCIAGPGALIKDSPGTLVLGGSAVNTMYNLYTGGTIVNAGELDLNGPAGNEGSVAGKGNLTINSGATVVVNARCGLGFAKNWNGGVYNITIDGGTLHGTYDGNTTIATNFTLRGGTWSGTQFLVGRDYGNPQFVTLASSTTSVIAPKLSEHAWGGGGPLTWPFTVAAGTTPSGVDLLLSGILNSGTAPMIKSGAGLMALTAVNPYTGSTTVSGGTLQLGNGGTTGSIDSSSGVSVSSGAWLAFNRTDTPTFDRVVSGAGGLSQRGSGTVYLTGSSSYTGPTTILAGTLNAATLANAGANSSIGAGTAGAASLVIDGGTLQYSGAGVQTTDRLLTIGASGATLDATLGSMTLGSSGGSIAFSDSANPASLNLTGTGTGALGANLGDSGTGANKTALSKTGSGTWTLTGGNTFSGATTISGGKLYLSAGNDNTPSITVTSGATLGGSGSAAAAAATIDGTSTVEAGSGGAGSLTLAGLSLADGSTVKAANIGSYSSNPAIAVTGSGSLSAAGTVTIRVSGTAPAGSGTARILQYAGAIGGDGYPAFVLNHDDVVLGERGSLSLTNDPPYVGVAFMVDQPLWRGEGGGTWVTAPDISGPLTANWGLLSSPSSDACFIANDAVLFNDTAPGSTTVSISAGDVQPSGVVFDNTAKSYTLSGANGIAGSALVIKRGDGVLTIANSNKFTGQLTVEAGTLAVSTVNNASADGPLGNSALPVILGSAGAIGTLEYTGSTGSGSKPFTMATSGTGEFQVDTAGEALTLSGAIDGGGNLAKTGAGRLILTAANDYGETAVSEGILQFGKPASLYNAATARWTPTYITVESGAVLAFNVGGAGEFTTANLDTIRDAAHLGGSTPTTGFKSGSYLGICNEGSVSYASVITDVNGGANPLGMRKSGAGTLLLTGLNTYTGGTIVDAGELDLNHVSGNNGTIRGNLTINPGAKVKGLENNAFGLGRTSPPYYENCITNTVINGGTLENGSGTTATFAGAVTMTAGTMTGGKFQWSGNFDGPKVTTIASSTPSVISADIDLNGAWAIAPTSWPLIVAQGTVPSGVDLLISGAVSSAGAYPVIKSGAGLVSLTGASTYTGNTTVNDGTLQADLSVNDNVIPAGSALVLGGGTLEIKGRNGATASQTVASLTTTASTSSDIVIDPSGGTLATLTITSSTLTLNGSVLIDYTACTTHGDTVGDGYVTITGYADGPLPSKIRVKDSDGEGSAKVVSGVVLRADLLGLPDLPQSGGVGTETYVVTLDAGEDTDGSLDMKQKASQSADIVEVDTTAKSGGVLNLDTYVLGLNTMFIEGPNPWSVAAGDGGGLQILGATAGSTLTVENNNAAGVTISAPVLNNNASKLTITGTGTTVLGGDSTFVGATTIGINSLVKLGATGTSPNSPLGTVAGATTVSSGGALDLNGIALATAEPLTLNGTGISGGGALLNGSGTAATYSGLITLGSASSIVAGNGDIVLSNAGTISGAYGLTLGGTSTGSSLASIIGIGANSVSKSGSGTWTLSGNSTYTGATAINVGTLKLGGAGSGANSPLGTVAAGTTVAAGAALDLNGFTLATAEALTLNGSGISSGGALLNSSAVTSVNYGGTVSLNTAARINSTVAGRLLTLTGGIAGGGNALTLGGAGDVTVSGGAIGGSGTSVIKDGAGTATLTAINTYSGATTINAGKLVGAVGGSSASSAVGVSPAAGTASLSVSITDNTKSWTCASLSTGGAGMPDLTFDFGGSVVPSTSISPLIVSGLAGFTKTPSVTIVGGANLLPGTYPLMTWGSKSGTAPTTTELVMPPLMNGALSIDGNTLKLTIIVPRKWNGNVSGAWDMATANWLDPVAPATYLNGADVTFDDTASGTFSVTLGVVVNPGSVTVNNTGNAYTITGSGVGKISGATGLTKSGSGTLTLVGLSNNYTGATLVSGGKLVGAVGGSCGSSDVTVSAGTLGIEVGSASQWACKSLNMANGTVLDFNFTIDPSSITAPLAIANAVTFGGTAPSVTVAVVGVVTPGDYPLMTWVGSQSGTAPTTASLSGGMTGSAALIVQGNTLILRLSSGDGGGGALFMFR